MITLIIADDDPIILQGLSMIISSRNDLNLLGTASCGKEAVALCRAHHPDVAVLDIRMPQMNGIAAAEKILEEHLSAPLLLTTFDEPDLIGEALDVGARGYILKNSPSERILSAIVTVAEGGTVFAPDVIDYIRSVVRIPNGNTFEGLTSREKEIVTLIAEGLSNAEIAGKLFLSNGTVRNHISTILEKTGLDHRTQIAVRYLVGS
ncbi:MAG: response regulator transcription factor [Clostridiales Family XIII bacterium]|jgi:DNA-binding NarL/FixJ family response regulator|nr:response regulator transcription factor [Clostridiales Family XIII bacterium]